MINIFVVMLGGAIGAAIRYGVGLAGLRIFGDGFPWWTLAINCGGGLAMGVVTGTLIRLEGQDLARLFLCVGLLGGFTTFSAFGLETWTMIERGAWAVAGAYVIASVVGAVALTGAGLWVARL